ncbi:hypothetical protein F5Y06DRAFT_306491 [Hypoxylon sp. FL0890]|nr:hypothetical protein F5Y06DRAFT_306491 [Hypoxylon sp. FL0890]
MGGRSQVFHKFSELPIELRFIIWTHNLPGPRIVEVKCNTDKSSTSQLQQSAHKPICCKSTLPIPVNLHVCRESRREALRRYKLLFGFTPESGRVFLDPLRDTLYFGCGQGVAAAVTLFNTFVSLVQPEDLAHVRYVAINEMLINYGNQNGWTSSSSRLTAEQILCQAHHHFVNMEKITFVCDDENPIYSSDAVFVEPRVANRILERRIQEAINFIEDQQPQFGSLVWSVRVIAAEPQCPTYDQSVLGYEGKRSTFFRECKLPRVRKVIAA